jgi:CDP-diacylglycerol---glycerol-3-phosphate 3-phosphatidyltransferase
VINANVQAFARRLAESIVAPLAAAGITPNTITVAGLFLNGGVAWVLSTGRLQLGGGLLLLAGAFDMLDGALARRTKSPSTFGAFLDSTLDRYSEAVIMIGLVYVSTERADTLAVTLILALLTGSFLVSYTRARAEGLGLECKVGLLQRPERIIILALGLIFNELTHILIALVALTNFTVAQRIFHVWRLTSKTDREGELDE